ncbi:helix-turn-helix domain-containing protein [Nocardia sp. NBC_01009]|uniref:helix-turn-helix domain-containing protein n=1 Tax=Nocardia sp. NBC_01009 TaxID=2975996 RepID=UPI00386BE3D1|nr:helix-turn-helix domain-containing protein [Nocardia sp. NBC_01009]
MSLLSCCGRTLDHAEIVASAGPVTPWVRGQGHRCRIVRRDKRTGCTLRLGPLLALPREERTRLLETLEHWYAAGGSAAEAGRRLYVHANTVRYRIRRVEELTGRSLGDPQAVLDLGAAVQALPVLSGSAAPPPVGSAGAYGT